MMWPVAVPNKEEVKEKKVVGEKVGEGRLGGYFVLWPLKSMREVEKNKEKECKGVIKTEDQQWRASPLCFLTTDEMLDYRAPRDEECLFGRQSSSWGIPYCCLWKCSYLVLKRQLSSLTSEANRSLASSDITHTASNPWGLFDGLYGTLGTYSWKLDHSCPSNYFVGTAESRKVVVFFLLLPLLWLQVPALKARCESRVSCIWSWWMESRLSLHSLE